MEASSALSPWSLPCVKLTTNGAGPAYSGLIHPVKLGGMMRGECQGVQNLTNPDLPEFEGALAAWVCPLEARVSPKSKCGQICPRWVGRS